MESSSAGTAIASSLLARPITHRKAIRYRHLPLISHLQRAAFRPRRRVAKRFIGKPLRLLYRIARKLGLGGHGTFAVDMNGREHQFQFDARNTQFTSLDDRAYEPDVAALLDILLDDHGVFFDIGANWGYFAIFVLGRANFLGSVHAFEGYPPTYSDLLSIAQQSPFGSRLVCHGLALSDGDREGQMAMIDGFQSGLARLDGTMSGFTVETRRLDSLDLPAPSLIKIDVEGHEAQVLRGARETIAKARPIIVLENWREPARPNITLEPLAILQDLRYQLFVPVWIQEAEGGSLATTATNGNPTKQFGLVEIGVQHRFLLSDQINILAYPGERIGELYELFPTRLPI